MKLTYEGLRDREAWAAAGVKLPAFDWRDMCRATGAEPIWVHIGSGNIFRVFIARLQNRLLNEGLDKRGIYAVSPHDAASVEKVYRPHDNMTLAVSLCPDGGMEREVIASVARTLRAGAEEDRAELGRIFRQPTLQMLSFTITEKGYALHRPDGALSPEARADMENGPERTGTAMGLTCALLYQRYLAGKYPLAVVSMDNCAHNGDVLRRSVLEMAEAWRARGAVEEGFLAYLSDEKTVSFPWSMIDKITPRPHPVVEEQLIADGVEEVSPFVTTKHTYIAPFVNAEKPQYLVIEDQFPNGRPPLEHVGVIITSRDIVNKVEKMKVCTCLNPLHTCLAIYGCLLGYTSIAAEMEDKELSRFIDRMSHEEGMPFVVDPGVIDPKKFLEEVLTARLPNPFMPDTPQRIATDTSQKLSIRFGETIKAYMASDTHEASQLKLIPLVLAGWLRYLVGKDDEGQPFEISPDPLLPAMKEKLKGIDLGQPLDKEQLRPILSDMAIFGVDLYSCKLADKVSGYLEELLAGPGAVRATLEKYV